MEAAKNKIISSGGFMFIDLTGNISTDICEFRVSLGSLSLLLSPKTQHERAKAGPMAGPKTGWL
jgi:hypothetical protein